MKSYSSLEVKVIPSTPGDTPCSTPKTSSSIYSTHSARPLRTPFNAHSSFELEIKVLEDDIVDGQFDYIWRDATHSPSYTDRSATLGDSEKNSLCSSPLSFGEPLGDFAEAVEFAKLASNFEENIRQYRRRHNLDIASKRSTIDPSTSPIPMMLDTFQQHNFHSELENLGLAPTVTTVGFAKSPVIPEIVQLPAINLFDTLPRRRRHRSRRSERSSRDSQYTTSSEIKRPQFSSLVEPEPFITGLEGWEPVHGIIHQEIPRSVPTPPLRPRKTNRATELKVSKLLGKTESQRAEMDEISVLPVSFKRASPLGLAIHPIRPARPLYDMI